MKNVIEQYGSALISAVSGLLVIGLLFTGLFPGTGGLLKTIGKETLLMGSTAGYKASDDNDLSFLKAAGEEGSLSLSEIEVESMLYVDCAYYIDSLARSLNGQEIKVRARSVEMLSVSGTGADVTDQVLSMSEDGREIICFQAPGSYRAALTFENNMGRTVSGNFVITAEREMNGELTAFA